MKPKELGDEPARTRTVGYVRVSTEEQSREGISLDAQRSRLASYADLYKLDLVEVIADEGVSAKTLVRPGIIRALAMLDDGDVEGIAVVKLDRLTRSLRDWNNLIDRYFSEKRGRKLFSVNEQIDTRSANGRMMLNMLIMVAQWEREIVAERTKDALAHKIATGQRCGKVRYGFDLAGDGKTLVSNPDEQLVIATIRRLGAEGRSHRGIAHALNALSVPTKERRGPWLHTAVARILKRTA